MSKAVSPLDQQVGGDHYRRMAIQPMEFILANGLGFVEGSVVKYVSRWQHKGGLQDLKKARQNLDFLIDLVERQEAKKAKAESALSTTGPRLVRQLHRLRLRLPRLPQRGSPCP